MCMAKCLAASVAGNVMIDWCTEEYLTKCISLCVLCDIATTQTAV